MTVKSSPIIVDDQPNQSEATSSAVSPNSSQQIKAKRPKAVSQWTVRDVQKWLQRHCSDYYNLYGEKFLEQDITGSSFALFCLFCHYLCKGQSIQLHLSFVERIIMNLH